METFNKKQINWEFVSFLIFCALIVLLPIFILPLEALPFGASKAFLLYFGISLAFFFWLLACLQKGEIKIPKSLLLLSAALIVVVWFISSLFSGNVQLSLIGRGYEIDTFSFFLFLSLALFLISLIFKSEKRGVIFYFLIFISALVAFLFQLFHTLFGVNIIFPNIFNTTTSNLLGSWNDLAIFFGFIGLSSLALFEMFKFGKTIKVMLFLLTLFFLLAMMAANFFTNWIIFGFFALVVFIYTLYKSFFVPKTEIAPTTNPPAGEAGKYNFIHLSLFVFAVVLFCILAKGTMGNFTALLNTASVEVRPSWSATGEIIKQVLRENPVLGSGPNTFLYDWLRFKPLAINSTIFWNTRFLSGIGHLPSMLATTGILGGVSLLAFLILLLFYGAKTLSYSFSENNLLQALLAVSFLGSIYLWAFVLFYSPGFVIFALAFLNTGLFLGMLIRAGKLKTIEISFLANPKIGFISVLLIVILILGSITSLYLFSQKARAAYYFNKAINILNAQGNLDETENNILKAISLDNQDEYLRALTEIDLLRIQEVLSQKDLPADQAKLKFQNALTAAIQSAQQSTVLNPKDPLNWMELGKVYESVIPFKITGADNMAITSYEQALKVSPFDPTPLFTAARVEVQSQKTKEARDYIQSVLNLKGDFAPAIFLLSQIEAGEGNLKEAINRTEQTALLAPNDIGVLFQLGLLYYQDNNLDNSRLSLERAISLNENYANAHYFLGLVYDKQGNKDKAIGQFENIAKTNPDNQEIQKILSNLKAGKAALEEISPPAKAPEKRASPPIGE